MASASSDSGFEVENDSPIMFIKYSETLIKKNNPIKGIFSFSIYMRSGGFNESSLSKMNVFMGDTKYSSLIYFVGIMSYVEMIKNNPAIWGGWRVVIHTDQQSIDDNPLAYKAFIDNGAIIGITTLKKYSEYRAIFRINRFFPLFIKGLDCPVFVRDADTIFETEIGREVVDKEKVLTVSDYILPDFIKNLSNWEAMYYEKLKDYKNKVVFSYDDEYFFNIQDENIEQKNGKYVFKNNSQVWLGKKTMNLQNEKTRNRLGLYPKVRFLAGIVSKIGESLPMELWYPGLNNFLAMYLSKIDKHGYPKYDWPTPTRETKIMWTDEVYLTDVIYKWCKENDSAEFFKMNYVRTYRIYKIGRKYFEKQYPNSIINSGNTLRINNTKIYNALNKNLAQRIFPKKGMTNIGFSAEQFKQKEATRLAFTHPDLTLTNESFNNPFKYKNDPSKKPESIPNYVWGGKKSYRTKRRHRHKRNTHKNRR